MLSSPVVHGDFVALGSSSQPISGYLLSHAGPPFGIKRLWTCPQVKTYYGLSAYHDGFLYTFHLQDIRDTLALACVNARTGEVALMEESIRAQTSLMLADGLIFARMGDKLILAEATPESFRKKGELDLGSKAGGGWIMPSLAYGRLYVRTDKELWCIQAAERLPSAAEVARSLGLR
jgi:hypothetical protein